MFYIPCVLCYYKKHHQRLCFLLLLKKVIFKKSPFASTFFHVIVNSKCKEQLVKEKNVSHISHCYCVSLDIVTQLKAAK